MWDFWLELKRLSFLSFFGRSSYNVLSRDGCIAEIDSHGGGLTIEVKFVDGSTMVGRQIKTDGGGFFKERWTVFTKNGIEIVRVLVNERPNFGTVALPEPFGVSKCEAVRSCGSEVFLLSWLEIERPPIEWRPKCHLKGSVKSKDLLYEAVCAAVVLDLKISNEA